MRQGWHPKPGDPLVRRPREAEIAPVQVRVEPRTVPIRGPTSPMLLVYGFLAVAAIGTLLLSLPISSRAPGFTPLLDAMFTATSAVTVTGLVVVDTDVAWTTFGQLVILGLIFIGGLGFMTGAAFLLLIVGQRLGLQNQLLIREGLGGGQLGTLTSLVKNIVIISVCLQAAGTVLLFLRYYVFDSLWEGIGLREAVWQSLFNSVSSFNNAGFEIMPDDLVGGPSLEGFASDYYSLGVMGLLIVIGGLGYTVLRDLVRVRVFSRMTLDTKLVLVGSVGLITLGAIVFLASDWANPDTLGNRSVPAKLAASVFDSAATRTAGMSTIDYSLIGYSRGLTTDALMFIGGASASTASGIKVNTFMVILLATVAAVKGRRRVTVFEREIPMYNVMRALVVGAVAVVSLLILLSLLVAVQSNLPFRDLLFETVSAFGTVGLSTGITDDLNSTGRIIITITMFLGRFGPLTLALLMTGRETSEPYRLAEERVRIG